MTPCSGESSDDDARRAPPPTAHREPIASTERSGVVPTTPAPPRQARHGEGARGARASRVESSRVGRVPKGDAAIDRAAGTCPKRWGRRGVGTCVRLCRTVHAPLRDRQFSA